MELNQDELFKAKRLYEERQRLNIEYSKKENEYRKRTKENDLNLTIIWQDTNDKIDKEFVRSKVEIQGIENFEENFTTAYLNLDKFLNFYCESEESANETYPKDQLWDTCRNDSTITKLISYVEDKNSVCPPIIDFTTEGILIVADGNHRIGLSRYLRLKEIPFIFRKSNEMKIRSI